MHLHLHPYQAILLVAAIFCFGMAWYSFCTQERPPWVK
jgi:hypothetical protein